MTRPRLTVVAPLPPSWTGIAEYTARLVPHLQRDWEVVAVIPDGEARPDRSVVACEVIHEAAWTDAAAPVGRDDRLLVCLGNSGFHVGAPAILRRHGGVVLAHDVRMTALQCLLAAVDTDPHRLSAVVGHRHGPELARVIRSVEEVTPLSASIVAARRALEEVNALLLAPTVEGADAIVVHSGLAARLATLDLATLDLGTGAPVQVVPFGHAEVTGRAPDRPGATIASFGMIEPEKRPDLLLLAFIELHRRRPDARLVMVGAGDPVLITRLQAMAARRGVAGAVTWTGRVSYDGYRRHLGRAAVAVQLRSVVNGEASAAVADCLAAGLPTVVSRLGAQAEIPDDVVAFLAGDADPTTLASLLARLLADQELRRHLGGAGSAWARDRSFAVAAGALSEVLVAAPPLRS